VSRRKPIVPARLQLLWTLFLCFASTPCVLVAAAEKLPPKPSRYFTDEAHVVSSATAERLNKTLEDFERDTSNQILAVIYPKMETDSSIEDYTVRLAQSWHVGQKGKDNGAVLFVFVQDRKMFIQVGYGLEGALPDATCKQIVENEIKPRFRNGDFDGGLSAAVNAMLAATRGEYKGGGTTVAAQQARRSSKRSPGWSILFFVFLFVMIGFSGRRRRYGFWGPMGGGWGGWTIGGGGFSSGGGGWSGGGDSGGFSSGGGSFGGGGAGGSW
jgi:uncharacterized protein